VGELARGDGGEKSVMDWEHAGHWAVRAALCILLFVLYILLISVIVVTVPFVCCSVKLPLSGPMRFCLFLSILLLTPAGEGTTEQLHGPFVVGRGPLAKSITTGFFVCLLLI